MLGPAGGPSCAPEGDPWPPADGSVRIDHLVLSHPHADHGNMLDSVLACYEVGAVWDAGHVNRTQFLRAFYSAVAAEPDVRFRTVRPVPADRTYDFGQGRRVRFRPALAWETFAAGHVEELGEAPASRWCTPIRALRSTIRMSAASCSASSSASAA